MLRKTAASVVASVALLSPGVATAQPLPEQAAQAVADSAAETYRQTRDRILADYHARTADAQRKLERAQDIEAGWREYKRTTREAAVAAKIALTQAREDFRQTVAAARGQV